MQLSVAVNRKMSFKEFRDLLILLYGDNIVSDEEFLLLHDTFKTKNPEFPHGNYERFDLGYMNSAECKAEFRVEKQDLPRLVAALQLPPVLRCEQRSICEDIEGLCMLLKRVYSSVVINLQWFRTELSLQSIRAARIFFKAQNLLKNASWYKLQNYNEMPAISIYKSTTTYPAIPLSSSAITAFLYRKALPETRKKYSFFHHGTIKLLSALFLFTNRPFRLKKSLRYPSRN